MNLIQGCIFFYNSPPLKALRAREGNQKRVKKKGREKKGKEKGKGRRREGKGEREEKEKRIRV